MNFVEREHYKELHHKAVEIVGRYKKAEADLIDILQKIDQAKSYREFHCTSLFTYAVKELGLTEDVAYNFINVARKAVEVPALKAAIANSEITVSKAKKITSVLTIENQSKWLAMAVSLPQKVLEKEVARVNPKAATQDRATYVTEKRMQLTMGLSEELMEQFKRVQDLECQKQQKAIDYEATLKALIELYLEHKDPVRMTQPKLVARLAKERVAAQGTHEMHAKKTATYPSSAGASIASSAGVSITSSAGVSITSSAGASITSSAGASITKTLTPARKQFVLRRDDAQCVQTQSDGNRCPAKRWLHIHHLKERAHGGTHAIENLTTLCAAHHRQLHQNWAPD